MTDRSYGQVAYEAYGDSRAWQTFAGDPMPRWENQAEELQRAWSAGAKVVAEETGRRILAEMPGGTGLDDKTTFVCVGCDASWGAAPGDWRSAGQNASLARGLCDACYDLTVMMIGAIKGNRTEHNGNMPAWSMRCECPRHSTSGG